MIDSGGHEIGSPDLMDDAAADYAYARDQDTSVLDAVQSVRSTLVVLTAVSSICMTVAIATGSYAIWLLKQQGTHKILTDVNDILQTCQTRMRQLESEVQQLPGRAT